MTRNLYGIISLICLLHASKTQSSLWLLWLFEIVTGVPQGSSLGPLLFLIYINDLPHTLSDTGAILFAEDTALYSSGTDRYTIQHKVQRDLSILESWCIENQLTINAKKPQYVIFSTGRQKDKCSGIKLRIEEHNLSEVDDYKYLGTI